MQDRDIQNTQYIQGREDRDLVSVYTDEGISATSTRHREGFRQMVEDALAEKSIFSAGHFDVPDLLPCIF